MTRQAQIDFQDALVELTKAERKVTDLAAALPAIPTDTEGDDFQIVEHGYSRYETLAIDILTDDDDNRLGQYFHGQTHGWDSMSETGCGEHVIIDGWPYAVPDDLDWD